MKKTISQRFSVEPDGDSLISISEAGFTETPLPLIRGDKMSFFIFHGEGGNGFRYQIAIESHGESGTPPFVPPFNEKPHLQNRTGTGSDLVLATDEQLQTDGGLGGGGGGGTSRFSLRPIKVELFRPHEDTPIYEELFADGQVPDQEIVPDPSNFQDGRRHFVFPRSKVNGNSTFPVFGLMAHFGWWRCDVTYQGSGSAVIGFQSRSFIKKLVVKETKVSHRWLKHTLGTALKALTPRMRVNGRQLTIDLLGEVSGLVSSIKPIRISEQLERDLPVIGTIGANGSIELVTFSAMPGRAGDVLDGILQKVHVFESERDNVPSTGDANVNQALRAFWQKKIDFYQNVLDRLTPLMFEDDLAITFSARFSNPRLEIDIPFATNPILQFAENPNFFLFFGRKNAPNAPPEC